MTLALCTPAAKPLTHVPASTTEALVADSDWVCVAPPGAVSAANGARLHCTVRGRYVTILRWGGALHCLDSVCYHAGGPLTAGDIEELPNGEVCVVCPWHAYPVSLSTGEKWYRATEKGPEPGTLIPAGWKSVGPRQRVHDVEERAEGLFVRLKVAGAAVESDSWAFNDACGSRCATSGPPPKQGRSGHALALASSRGADGKRLF